MGKKSYFPNQRWNFFEICEKKEEIQIECLSLLGEKRIDLFC